LLLLASEWLHISSCFLDSIKCYKFSFVKSFWVEFDFLLGC
jgi:hypothetical protein